MHHWFLLYSTQSLPHATIVKGMLEENSVPVMLVNRQASGFFTFTDIELYVPALLKDVARHLVDNSLLN